MSPALRHIVPDARSQDPARFICDLAEVLEHRTRVTVHYPAAAAIPALPFDQMYLQSKGVLVRSGEFSEDPAFTILHTYEQDTPPGVADMVLYWGAESTPPQGLSVRRLRRAGRPDRSRRIVTILRPRVDASGEDPLVIELLQRLPADIELAIPSEGVGDICAAVQDRKERGALHLPTPHFVHLEQFVSASHAVVVTGTERWPRMALYAAAAGVPVIMTPTVRSAFTEPPEHRVNVWLAETAADVWDVLTRLHAHPQAARQLAAGGKLWASAYDIHITGAAWRTFAATPSKGQ